jgi:hypothetical protein
MEVRDQDHKTLGSLLRELMEEGRDLFKQEITLAKTEASEKASLFGRNAGYLAAGGAVAFAGGLFILAAVSRLLIWAFAAAGLSAPMAAWLGPGVVGLAVTIIGAIMAAKAMKTFKNGSLKPDRTVKTLKEDKQWARHQLQRA